MFVHLRLHTEFSIVDSTCRIDDVVKAASRDQQPALAITDLSNLFGAIKFYKAARGAGLKPLIGADVCTIPPATLRQLVKHPLTDAGLQAFLADWAKTGQTII